MTPWHCFLVILIDWVCSLSHDAHQPGKRRTAAKTSYSAFNDILCIKACWRPRDPSCTSMHLRETHKQNGCRCACSAMGRRGRGRRPPCRAAKQAKAEVSYPGPSSRSAKQTKYCTTSDSLLFNHNSQLLAAICQGMQSRISAPHTLMTVKLHCPVHWRVSHIHVVPLHDGWPVFA